MIRSFPQISRFKWWDPVTISFISFLSDIIHNRQTALHRLLRCRGEARGKGEGGGVRPSFHWRCLVTFGSVDQANSRKRTASVVGSSLSSAHCRIPKEVAFPGPNTAQCACTVILEKSASAHHLFSGQTILVQPNRAVLIRRAASIIELEILLLSQVFTELRKNACKNHAMDNVHEWRILNWQWILIFYICGICKSQ